MAGSRLQISSAPEFSILCRYSEAKYFRYSFVGFSSSSWCKNSCMKFFMKTLSGGDSADCLFLIHATAICSLFGLRSSSFSPLILMVNFLWSYCGTNIPLCFRLFKTCRIQRTSVGFVTDKSRFNLFCFSFVLLLKNLHQHLAKSAC